MGVFNSLKALFEGFFKKEEPVNQTIYSKEPIIEEVHSLWDYITFNMQSQAHHICSVLGFDEWVSMEEILRRIKELFGVKYKNERSLYPYIKTLVDCGLLETSGFSSKKHWRKRDLIIKIDEKSEIREKTQAVVIEKQKS